MDATPRIVSSTEMSIADARWVTLKKLKYLDVEGNERFWEYAERKTRNSGGIDSVAVLAILRSKTNAFPISTVVIEQFRPPIGKHIIELPAGLVDEGETPEEAALRELEEETGFKAQKVSEISSVLVSDPGMTNCNVKLVTVSILLEDGLELPEPSLEAGEFLVKRVVPLAELKGQLEEYDKRGYAIDACLAHFASGYDMAQRSAMDQLLLPIPFTRVQPMLSYNELLRRVRSGVRLFLTNLSRSVFRASLSINTSKHME